jgi:hypothetical protein
MSIIGTCLDCAPAAGSVALTVFVGIAGLILGLLREAAAPAAAVAPRR